MLSKLGRPSPGTVIASLALFFAVAGGSAIALDGRNTVDSGDIKRGQVKTSDIANNAVTTRKIKANAVRTGDIGNRQVRTIDIQSAEARRSVGPGGVPLGFGVEGDCIWTTTSPSFPVPFRLNPPGFYKDALGYVHLTGIVFPNNGPGGDGNCGGGAGEQSEDSVAFILPEGYRPDNDVLATNAGGATLIVGDTPLSAPPEAWPAGAVASGFTPGTPLILDGVVFEPAGLPGGVSRRDSAVSSRAASGADAKRFADLFG